MFMINTIVNLESSPTKLDSIGDVTPKNGCHSLVSSNRISTFTSILEASSKSSTSTNLTKG